jgi:hypothetical protein
MSVAARARRLADGAAREALRRGRLVVGEALWRADVLTPPAHAWLLGGFVGGAFGDNSAALFRHLRRARPDVAARYVIDAAAKDAAAAADVGPVFHHGGIDACAAALAADVLVVSHGLHDVPGFASPRASALRVRLGHGLTAFKTTKPPPLRSQADLARLYGLVPVASEFERKNKQTWGIADDALVVCGVARFDDLVARARASAPEPRVLYMPTWRDWLGGVDDASPLLAFLRHPALAPALRARGVHLDVYLHRLFAQGWRDALRDVDGDVVHVYGVDVDVQGLLARSRALLTDYSSVTWDMLYLDRPVAFFAPDVDDYVAHRGGYFDLRHDLPGPCARSADAAVRDVCDVIDGGFVVDAAGRAWQGRAFAFRDDQNCARIAAAIDQKLDDTRGSRRRGGAR